MRFKTGLPRAAARLALLPAAALIAAAATVPADAGRLRERAWADSFGNLVVQSPSGYKRIIVGGADDLLDSGAGLGHVELPDVVYFKRPGSHPLPARTPQYSYRCEGGATVVKGRGYMYGIPRGGVAVIDAVCD